MDSEAENDVGRDGIGGRKGVEAETVSDTNGINLSRGQKRYRIP